MAAGRAGKNEIVHVPFARVRRPSELSKLVGVDVRGFRHSVSNQAMRHTLDKHGSAASEEARGQIAVTRSDFQRLPEIIAKGRYQAAKPRAFGPPRVAVVAEIDRVKFTYIAEVRRKQKRLDLISMWKG